MDFSASLAAVKPQIIPVGSPLKIVLMISIFLQYKGVELIETQSPKAAGVRIPINIEKSYIDNMIKAFEEKFDQSDKLGIYVKRSAV